MTRQMLQGYYRTRENARLGGVEFSLTPEEFEAAWGIWWIGRARAKFYLGRIDDAHGYEVGNVRVMGKTKARDAWIRKRQ